MRWSLVRIDGSEPEPILWKGDTIYRLAELKAEFEAKDLLSRYQDLSVALENRMAENSIIPIGSDKKIRFLPPFLGKKIICAGLNYRDHAREAGIDPPPFPNFFIRYPDSLVGHGEALQIPPGFDSFDYEGELAVVIGQSLYGSVGREEALAAVAGYTLFNDGSLRELQFRASQWTLGKNCPASGSCGPWVCTPDELPLGANGLSIQTRINGELLQHGNTGQMIFAVADLLTTLAAALPLGPGDLIATGTPAGVGFARTPPRFLRPGDRCEIEIEGLGKLSNPVI